MKTIVLATRLFICAFFALLVCAFSVPSAKAQTACSASTIPPANHAVLYALTQPSQAGGGSVSVIDTTQGSVACTIAGNGNYMAASPDGAFVYVSSGTFPGQNVSRIDTFTGAIVGLVPPQSLGGVGTTLGQIAISSDGAYAYVTSNGPSVYVLNTSSSSVPVVAGISVPPGQGSFNSNGWISASRTHGIYVSGVDASGSGAVINIQQAGSSSSYSTTTVTIPGTNAVGPLAVTPDGNRVYVGTNVGVSVLAATSNSVTSPVLLSSLAPSGAVSSNISSIAITPDGTTAYVEYGYLASGTAVTSVAAIRTSDNTVIANTVVSTAGTSFGDGPIAIDPTGAFVYATNNSTTAMTGTTSAIGIISTTTNTLVNGNPSAYNLPGGNGLTSITALPVSVAISPAFATSQGVAVPFTATVSHATNTNVTWEVDGVANGNAASGTITNGGSYLPPAASANTTSHSIQAVANATSAAVFPSSASVPVTIPGPNFANDPTAYIAAGSNGVIVFDRTSLTPVQSIATGPAFSLAMLPDGSGAYVPNQQGSLIFINTANNSVDSTRTINNVGTTGVVVTPDGKAVLSTGSGSVYISPLSSNQTSPASLQVGGTADAVAVSADATTAYVGNCGYVSVVHIANGVFTLDPTTILISADYAPGAPCVEGLAIPQNSSSVYAASPEPCDTEIPLYGEASIINPLTKTSANIQSTPCPSGIGASPDGSKVYVSNSPAGVVQIVATASNTVTGALSLGGTPGGIAIPPDGRLGLIADSSDRGGKVDVIDVVNSALYAQIPLSITASGLSPNVAITPVNVTVSPASAGVVTTGAGNTVQLTATVRHDNSGVTWSVNGIPGGNTSVGTITATANTGLNVTAVYTAPPFVAIPTQVAIQAASDADATKAATSTVTVSPPTPTCSLSGLPGTPVPTAATVTASLTCTAQPTDVLTSTVNWGDNSSSSPATATANATGAVVFASLTHTYSSPGSFTVSPTVTDTTVSLAATVQSASVTVVTVAVSVAPATATVNAGLSLPFTATVTPGTVSSSVTWSVTCASSSCGTITPAGVYTAPASPPSGNVTVKATSVADSTKLATASVTVASLPAPVSVTVTPMPTTVAAGTQVQFTATVQNAGTSTGVTWKVTSGAGSINSSGLYTAPGTVPSSPSVTVTATSIADPTKSSPALTFTLAANGIVTQGTQTGVTVALGGSSSIGAQLIVSPGAPVTTFTLVCTMPAGFGCKCNPGTVTTDSVNGTNFTLTVFTPASTSTSVRTVRRFPAGPSGKWYPVFVSILGVLFCLLYAWRATFRQTRNTFVFLALICLSIVFLGSCSGISQSSTVSAPPVTIPAPGVQQVPAVITATPAAGSPAIYQITQLFVPLTVQ